MSTNEVCIDGIAKINEIPESRESVRRLLEAAKVKLPKVLPSSGVKVATKKKLPIRRKKQ